MSAPPVHEVVLSTVATHLTDWLRRIGVKLVFGVSGGGVAPLWQALSVAEGIELIHTQHESGAAFAATEASLASGAPVVVFTTTGPGLTNALTGAIAARKEGAHVLLLSGVTPADRRFRDATQETGPSSCLASLHNPGPFFDEAAVVEHPAMLGPLLRRFEEGLADPAGFVGHLGLPSDLQGTTCDAPHLPSVRRHPSEAPTQVLDDLADELSARRVAIVAGFHARSAQAELTALAERLGAPVFATPRAHGVLPASHALWRGVIGFAGHQAAEDALRAYRPEILLVLGSELGEGASQWCTSLRPTRRTVVIHPDAGRLTGAIEAPEVERVSAPLQPTLASLVDRLQPVERPRPPGRPEEPGAVRPATRGVCPARLVDTIQRVVVEQSDAIVMAEAGNAFAWAIHRLRFEQPRLRVSVGWGSMGHFTTGVIGAALTGRRAVALVGDGAMLMMNELGTAARHDLDATWVVLNDSSLGMCRHGARAIGVHGVDTRLAEVDFAAYAAAMGVPAWVVRSGADLEAALRKATTGRGPRLLDVRIDEDVPAPIERRVAKLTWSGSDEVSA